MMLLKKRLAAEAFKNNVKWEIIEQDFVLSWILEGIASVPDLKNAIAFKGGTALKKSYFGDYRFSQDLDFSVINDTGFSQNLDALMMEACSLATNDCQASGENITFQSAPYVEKRPHPDGQKAYVIQGRLPWHRTFATTVYVELTFGEYVIMPCLQKSIIYPYGDPLTGRLNVYPLEEIIAEKMRALLQFAKKLHERGWARSRVRDYYDLWRIFTNYHQSLNLSILPDLIQKKCAHKNIPFQGYEDIFQTRLAENIDLEWRPWLENIIPHLPDKDMVINDLKEFLKNVFG